MWWVFHHHVGSFQSGFSLALGSRDLIDATSPPAINRFYGALYHEVFPVTS